MRKAFRHTGVLMMLGVVALGLIGAAYTLWYQNLSVTTTINTGTLAANWSFHPWSAGTSGEGTFGATSTSGLGKPVVALITSADNVGVNASASQILGQGGTGSGSARFTYGNFNPPTNVGSPTPVKPVPTCEGALSPTDSGATSLTLTIGGLFPFAGCEFQIDIDQTQMRIDNI